MSQNLSSKELLMRIESIELSIVELLNQISSNSHIRLDLDNAHCSLIKSRQFLSNSGGLAPLFLEPVKREGI